MALLLTALLARLAGAQYVRSSGKSCPAGSEAVPSASALAGCWLGWLEDGGDGGAWLGRTFVRCFGTFVVGLNVG